MVRSLIHLSSLSKNEILNLVDRSLSLKSTPKNWAQSTAIKGCAGLLFFEPSTRTRFSFETACIRAGVHPLVMDGGQGTSLEKGESIEDTILNIEAMRPLFFVIRCPDYVNLDKISSEVSVPIINAGWGQRGHPTQALLDVMTLIEKWGSIEGKKILFVGDVRHSRVVKSHQELSAVLGYKVAYCAPSHFRPKALDDNFDHSLFFSRLEDGLAWADAVVVLRVQKERHDSGEEFETQEYRSTFGLSTESLKPFKRDGLLLHPGPINYGVEMEKEVLKDPRSVILQLVENGVFIREMIIRHFVTENF